MLAYRDRFGVRSSLNLVVSKVELAISRVRSVGISTLIMIVSAGILLAKKGGCSSRSSLGIGECTSRSSLGVGELASRLPSALASRACCWVVGTVGIGGECSPSYLCYVCKILRYRLKRSSCK
jgi:hypothetical protein